MSGEYVDRLKSRARAFLREAERVEEPDLAVLFAEQSMQLYIKAVYYELFGEKVRGHRLRELLSVFVKMLEAHGFRDLADRLLSFAEENRRMLILAEEAYSMS
ncbi:HEPN domain-containing protein [Thermogladius sp. 4427co]|uniref:HEPN domain-containing protein n=1 Tax=Thermogladius sp. 4427co TaxID=3450718 RepID=UPI003F7AFB09